MKISYFLAIALCAVLATTDTTVCAKHIHNGHQTSHQTTHQTNQTTLHPATSLPGDLHHHHVNQTNSTKSPHQTKPKHKPTPMPTGGKNNVTTSPNATTPTSTKPSSTKPHTPTPASTEPPTKTPVEKPFTTSPTKPTSQHTKAPHSEQELTKL